MLERAGSRARILSRGGRVVASLTMAILALATVSMVSSPAQADAPDNDTWQTATPVTSLRFTDTVDTTEATPDVGMGRYRFHGVWYHIQLPNDGPLFVLVRSTDLGPYFKVRLFHAANATDPPDQWTSVRSDYGYSPDHPAAFKTDVKGGEHYYLLLGTNREGVGGTANLVLRRPARIAFRLAKYGALDRVDGSAALHGTIRSTWPATVRLYVGLRQLVGDHVVAASNSKYVVTNADQKAWTLRFAASRSYRSGPARVAFSRLQVFDHGVLVGTHHFVRNLVILR